MRRLLNIVGTYSDWAELFLECPQIAEEDIRQALDYAGAMMADEVLP